MDETEKFCQETDELFALLMNQEKCLYHPPGEPFEMWDDEKKWKVTAVSDCPCIHIPDLDQCWPLSDMSLFRKENPPERSGHDCVNNREETPSDYFKKCADHVVFLYDRESREWSLYILEMKTTIGMRTWNQALKQFHGALFRACSIGILLHIRDFARIHTGCSFRIEKSLSENEPVLGKAIPQNPWEVAAFFEILNR